MILPYPPSVNHYWESNIRYVKKKARINVRVSKKGVAYRKEVVYLCKKMKIPKLKGKVNVRVIVNPPDRRKRDLDNLLKALLDALSAGNVYDDDFQVERLSMVRQEVVKNGRVKVIIKEI